MLIHWMKWDFRMFRVQWMLLLGITAAMFLLFPLAEMFQYLGFILFIFSILPATKLVGVKFRSQHVMSRNYLLSLPICRRRNFLYMILRLQIFTLPFAIFVCLFPSIGLGGKGDQLMQMLYRTNFYMLVPLVCIWLTAFQLMTQISLEKISTYLTSFQRFVAWTIHLLVCAIEFAVVSGLVIWASFFRFSLHFDSRFLILTMGFITGLRLYFTGKKWMEA